MVRRDPRLPAPEQQLPPRRLPAQAGREPGRGRVGFMLPLRQGTADQPAGLVSGGQGKPWLVKKGTASQGGPWNTCFPVCSGAASSPCRSQHSRRSTAGVAFVGGPAAGLQADAVTTGTARCGKNSASSRIYEVQRHIGWQVQQSRGRSRAVQLHMRCSSPVRQDNVENEVKFHRENIK
jgi:hypothetical protein